METMRYSETKKKSYKVQIFFLLLFLGLGSGIIYYAISNEQEPTLIGKVNSDTTAEQSIEESNALEEVPLDKLSELYKITDRKILDNTSKRIKPNVTLPQISINNELITEFNDNIYEQFNKRYESFKSNESSMNNNFTYMVTYKVYENIVNDKNIVSITVYERMIDDSSKNTTMQRLYAYNLDLKDGTVISLNDIAMEMFGSSYKDVLRANVKDYVVGKNMLKEDEYTYTITGLESFYIRDNNLRILFNPGDVVDSKHNMLDITIEKGND